MNLIANLPNSQVGELLASNRRRAPSELKRRGTGLWREILAVYRLKPAEYQTLWELCRVADRLDALDREIAEQGSIVTGSRGQPVANPLLHELRETQRTMSRLVSDLDLPMPPRPARF